MKVLRVIVPALVCAALGTTTLYAAGYVHVGRGDQASPAVVHTTPTPTPSDSPTPSPTKTPTSAPTTAPTSAPPVEPAYVLVAGDRGTQVRELQQRLFQLQWLPEQTTGAYDATTVTAVRGFQAKHDLKVTGKVDDRTWRTLRSLTKTPTHDAMFNVLHPGPALLKTGASGHDVRDLQARLKAIAWYFGDVTGEYGTSTVEAVKGFQAKRGIPVTGEVDQRTLDRLHAMTDEPSHEALFNIAPALPALDARCLHGRVLCIDKTSRTLRWVVDGKVLQTLDARFGSTVNDTPTREGLFHVYRMDADHVSTLYGSSMPYAMFFSGGQAVHYSSDFATVGYYGASHGCVNIRDYDGIAWLFSQVHVGDKVVVYWA